MPPDAGPERRKSAGTVRLSRVTLQQELVTFWFEESGPELWFASNEKFDQTIRRRFLAHYEAAARGKYDHWRSNGTGCIALCLLLDQFPRNLFRNDARAFATDKQALGIARLAVEKGLDMEEGVTREMRKFLYLPFEHSEDLEDQRLCLKLMAERLEPDGEDVKWARKHLVIIERFGRFPHRNEALGRQSTPEEREFLKGPDSSF